MSVLYSHASTASFTEIPESKNISVGEFAEFICRHTTADVIVWEINGESISNINPPCGIIPEIISGGSKLTVVGRLDFDGLEVVCVARYFSPSPDESTNPAILQGMCIKYRHKVLFRAE